MLYQFGSELLSVSYNVLGISNKYRSFLKKIQKVLEIYLSLVVSVAYLEDFAGALHQLTKTNKFIYGNKCGQLVIILKRKKEKCSFVKEKELGD